MAICLTAGLVTYRWSKSKSRGNHQGGPLEKIFLLSFYSILLGTALVFSKSRAGLVCLVFALAGMGVFYAKSYRKAYFTALIVVALLVAAFSVWIGVNPLPTRFLELPGEVSTEDARPAVWAQSLKLWTMAPLIGQGPSTFEDAFRSFGGGNILARYQHAHNDYLEILVETGLLGFLLLLGGVGISIAMTVTNLTSRNSRFARMYSLGMVAAVFAVLMHGLLDFNLQIPANRLTFFTILGLAYLTAGRRLRQ
jgi:O-antigen ligase